MSFAFIPNAVKKKKPVLVSSHAPSASISVGAQVTSESVDNSKGTKDQASSESVKNKTKIYEQGSRSVTDTETKSATTTSITGRKDLFDLEDLAHLVCLALSDYAVWADVDLRRKIDWGNNQDHYDDDTDKSIDDNNGYIPLAFIMRHSEIFRLASALIINVPQTTFIKAIRMHASHLIDVRLIIPSSSSSTFPRNNTAHWTNPHIQTGYELRRKEVLSDLSKHGKKEWDALTIYAENIPDQYRSIAGITRFFNGLLPPSPSYTNSPVSRIQNISLPSHHQDQPNSIPTCKSFALVTLSYDEDVDALLKAWSWDHSTDVVDSSDLPMETGIKSGKGKDRSLPDEEISPSYLGAIKFGLRILTKARWEELRAEYLLYRQELVDEINAFQDEGEVSVYDGSSRKVYAGEIHDQEEQEDPRRTNQFQVQNGAYIQSRSTTSVDTPGIHFNSAYPPGCLVFVRNVHPETNKTTLRALFLHAMGPTGIEVGKKVDEGLDYLDYTKGMDCCYVRLRTPLHAQQLVNYLSSTPIVQASGLDTSGASVATHSSLLLGKGDSPSITAEQVLGKREEVYWQKVPEKIRRQAVDKALLHTGLQ